jgi:HD-like signal output (HDOD) protein
MSKLKPEVDAWIQSLSDDDMPGFAGTVAEVNEEISSQDTSAVGVARSVLKDPALTSRLLKMANSFYYNSSRKQISTVSRAVMILGFEQVKALALSLVLIDLLKAGHQRDKLTDEIAQSFHAAVQAQEFAKLKHHESPENVFIAALLSRLGHMAFWAFADKEANQIIELTQSGVSQVDAENIVLKFSLHELSQGLGKAWGLGEMLERSLADDKDDDVAITIIKLSHQLAESSKEGSGNQHSEHCLNQLATALDIKRESIKDICLDNAKLAKDITQLYGVSKVSQLIPQPPLIDTEEPPVNQEHLLDSTEQIIEELEESFPEPNPKLQLTILQDMANAIEERLNFNLILEMTLEGLHRGVGMDRAGFAILSKVHQSLSFKYAFVRLMKS